MLAQKPPLLVHLLFHPKSSDGRELARHLHRQLNDDATVPGLRVPTVFWPAIEPAELQKRLDLAERSFVVVLADAELYLANDWCSAVADVWGACPPRHRCVPVQLHKNAWPLDKRLEQTNFVRAFAAKDSAEQKALVSRRVVMELCRYLLGIAGGDDGTAPVRLFLSHTKVDLNEKPKVVEKLQQHLNAFNPVESWTDSGDIPSGSTFSEEIEKGVARTSLLVVLTDRYATREWCRREVLMAKEKGRPAAVIDALRRYEVRSFPYLGNLPTVRWDRNPQTGIDLLLKETLRQLHTAKVLEQSQRKGDRLFLRPPELATLVGLPARATVLYPDPPVGVEEALLLGKTKVKCITPLQRLALDRPLKGQKVVLSMSESTDIDRYGLDDVHLRNVMLENSRYLLIKGATLAYGGDFRESGYTQSLIELVRAHNDVPGVEPFERVVVHRAWPFPRLDVNRRAELKAAACDTIELPRPKDVDQSLHADFIDDPPSFSADLSAAHRYAWARGLSEMRAFQSDAARSGIRARILLGGKFGPTVTGGEGQAPKESWYLGAMPGLLEEALLSAEAGQPLFIIGAFGGGARLVADILRGRKREEATWEFQKGAPFAEEMRKLYGPKWRDYDDIVQSLQGKGVAGINPHLKKEEHEELFDTIDPVRMVQIILTGLGRLAKGEQA
jgi:SLOG cluster2/TIR domain